MPSPFHGINLASNALRAFQRQLDVTGNNIGNVNTPGYSRQVADLVTPEGTTVYGVRPFTIGNGVSIGNVNRIRDQFLETRRMSENAQLGRFTTLSGGLRGVLSVYGEPSDTGIANALDQFFNSWSALASNPGSPGARETVQAAGATLASRVRTTYGQLVSAESLVTTQIDGTLARIDELAARIADLNGQIRQRVGSGDQPNELLDARDQAIKDLSGLVDLTTYRNGDGGISVYVNQFTLVDSVGSHAFPKTYDALTSTVTDGVQTYDVRSGKLAGLFGTISKSTGYRAQLDTFANSLRTSVNSMHSTGVNENNTTGIAFFNDANPQTGAIDFDLDAQVKADARNISAGVSGASGDGGLALALSRIRDDTTIAGLGGRSPTSYYADLVSGIGRDASAAEVSSGTQEAIVSQIDLQVQSISGVSLDDEMANMMKFQRSYQAAAKALTVFDQVTEDLINMLRR